MKKIYKILIVALLFRIVLSFITYHPDLNNHIDWGIRFFQYGAKGFYAPNSNVWSFTWPNQPPGTAYMFAGIRKLFEFLFSIVWWVNINIKAFPSGITTYLSDNLYPALLKLPAILSDLGIAFIIFKFFKKEGKEKLGIMGAILFLANPIIWYNSALWGQTDSIISFLAILGLWFMFNKRLALAFISLALCFYIKISLFIFIPIFLIVLYREKYKLIEIVKSFLIAFVIIGLLTIPFAIGNPYTWLITIYQNKVLGQQLQLITANGFNLWAAIAGIHERPQSLLLGPFSYQVWGTSLFVLSIIPILYITFKKYSKESVVWGMAMVAFASFVLMTNMHERYLYPLFPYLTILVVKHRKLVPYFIIISVIHLLNLYNFWWFPRIEAVVSFLSFGDRITPRVLGFAMFLIFLYFYKVFLDYSKKLEKIT